MIEENNITTNLNPVNYIITNKSNIEKKKISDEKTQDIKDLQFLYQITNQNFPTSQFKKDLNAFFENGQNFFGLMSQTSNLGGNIYKISSSDNLLYKSKVISFNNNLNSFHNKLNFIRENNKKANEIIKFINNLKKESDLFLDKDFDIKENDSFFDVDKIILHHRFIKNFEDLINIKDKNFKIYYKDNKLMCGSDFYEYYTKKYSLIFSLRIQTNSFQIDYSNDRFDSRLIMKQTTKEMEMIFLFYLKYILYKFLKEEIDALRKYVNTTKATSFEYKGLSFIWKKTPKKYIIKCNYFDNLEITFTISKILKSDKELKNINSRKDDQIFEYFKIFCRNISREVKYSKKIANFISTAKKSQNLTFENIVKSSIFIKSLSKLGLLVLKTELNKIITKETKESNYICSEYFSPNHYFAKYQLIVEFLDKGIKIFYFIHLYFDLNLNLTINVKEPYLNHIYVFDSSQLYSLEKGKINFNNLFPMLKNVLPLLEGHNYKDISIKILSL